MGWFSREKAPIAQNDGKKVRVPEGLWTKCQKLPGDPLLERVWKRTSTSARNATIISGSRPERASEPLLDEGSFIEFDADLDAIDFLEFKDSKSYQDRIRCGHGQREVERRGYLWRRNDRGDTRSDGGL